MCFLNDGQLLSWVGGRVPCDMVKPEKRQKSKFCIENAQILTFSRFFEVVT